jgi:hypothetical protein
MPNDLVVKRRRSGSERRRRTDPVILRLLPSEARALRHLAERNGHASVQALIVEVLRPLIGLCEPGADSTTSVRTSGDAESS